MGQQRENTLVAGRNLHEYYDIVGSLPLELVIQIVYHLDEADIVRSQRVRLLLSKFKALILQVPDNV
mgnify:CR=1 FL=1